MYNSSGFSLTFPYTFQDIVLLCYGLGGLLEIVNIDNLDIVQKHLIKLSDLVPCSYLNFSKSMGIEHLTAVITIF